jgi:hypothetical protein
MRTSCAIHTSSGAQAYSATAHTARRLPTHARASGTKSTSDAHETIAEKRRSATSLHPNIAPHPRQSRNESGGWLSARIASRKWSPRAIITDEPSSSQNECRSGRARRSAKPATSSAQTIQPRPGRVKLSGAVDALCKPA